MFLFVSWLFFFTVCVPWLFYRFRCPSFIRGYVSCLVGRVCLFVPWLICCIRSHNWFAAPYWYVRKSTLFLIVGLCDKNTLSIDPLFKLFCLCFFFVQTDMTCLNVDLLPPPAWAANRFGSKYSAPFLQDWVPWTLVKRLSWNRDLEGGIDRESKEEREKRRLRAERWPTTRERSRVG